MQKTAAYKRRHINVANNEREKVKKSSETFIGPYNKMPSSRIITAMNVVYIKILSLPKTAQREKAATTMFFSKCWLPCAGADKNHLP